MRLDSCRHSGNFMSCRLLNDGFNRIVFHIGGNNYRMIASTFLEKSKWICLYVGLILMRQKKNYIKKFTVLNKFSRFFSRISNALLWSMMIEAIALEKIGDPSAIPYLAQKLVSLELKEGISFVQIILLEAYETLQLKEIIGNDEMLNHRLQEIKRTIQDF